MIRRFGYIGMTGAIYELWDDPSDNYPVFTGLRDECDRYCEIRSEKDFMAGIGRKNRRGLFGG